MGSYIKTIVLLGFLSVLLITVGGMLGGQDGIYMAFFFALLVNGGAYFFSDKLALAASGAKPVTKSQAPELYGMAEDLAKKMHIQMPKLYVTPATQANAFATGRDPKHASVAVTKGILDTLSPQELKAVLAHELSHVKNRDILIASVAAVLASSLSFLANMSFYGAGSRNEGNRGSGMLGIIVALLVPIGAAIIQMAISREREYDADKTGAKTIGKGEPLAAALLKIHESARRHPLRDVNPAFSSLYIGNPLGGFGGTFVNLFSTHPPVAKRIERLKAIK